MRKAELEFFFVIVCLASASGSVGPAPTRAGTGPAATTAPGPTATTRQEAKVRERVPIEYRKTQLDARERQIVSATRDRTSSVLGAALRVLVEKAATLEAETIARQSVAVRRADLLAHPDDYRGRLVRLEAAFAESVDFERPRGMASGDRLHSVLAWERDSGEPVSMIAVGDPGRLAKRVPILLAGYFYKLRADEPRASNEEEVEATLLVPVIVGRAVQVQPRPPFEFDLTGFSAVTLLVGLAILAAAWFALRARIRSDRGRRSTSETKVASPDSDTATDPDAPENRPIDLEALERGESPPWDGE